MLDRPAEVRLRATGEGIHGISVLGFPPLLTHPELPPPSNPPNPILPAREIRLPIITFPAETVEGWQ